MNDQEFREQHQPLHVPAHFETEAPLKERLAFALADLGEGTAEQVVNHLLELQGAPGDITLKNEADGLLRAWSRNGLVTVNTEGDVTKYNLHKITEANSGSVNPRLLAPGLD